MESIIYVVTTWSPSYHSETFQSVFLQSRDDWLVLRSRLFFWFVISRAKAWLDLVKSSKQLNPWIWTAPRWWNLVGLQLHIPPHWTKTHVPCAQTFCSPGRWGVRARGNYPGSPRVPLFIQVELALDWTSIEHPCCVAFTKAPLVFRVPTVRYC